MIHGIVMDTQTRAATMHLQMGRLSGSAISAGMVLLDRGKCVAHRAIIKNAVPVPLKMSKEE